MKLWQDIRDVSGEVNHTMSKLQVIGLSRTTVVLGALVPSVLTAITCWLLGVNMDRNIGITGTVLAIFTFALSQWQVSGPINRRVLMIPKSRSPFSAGIHRGLTESVNAYGAISMSTEWPKEDDTNQLEWQLGILRSPGSVRLDGLVIVPAADDERLWCELARLSRAGTFVVVVDTKPQNAFFAIRQSPRPCFVGSDFRSGGELVGSEVIRLLTEDPHRKAVVAVGPASSWPGSERSRGICHRLCSAGVAHRVSFVEIGSWSKQEAAELLVRQILKAVKAPKSSESTPSVIAFCGNDKILNAVERMLLHEVDPALRNIIQLIGYDGAITIDGELLAHSCELAIATVDTQPETQGRKAAEALIEEHRGLLTSRVSIYIDPRLVVLKHTVSENEVRNEA